MAQGYIKTRSRLVVATAACLLLAPVAAARADTITVTPGPEPRVGEALALNASGTVDRDETVGVDIFVFPGHSRPCPTGHRDETPYFEEPHEEPLIGAASGPGPYSLDASWTPPEPGNYRLCGLVHSLEDQRQGYATDTRDIVVGEQEADIAVDDATVEDVIDHGDVFQYVTEVRNDGPAVATDAAFEDEVAGNGKAQSVSSTHGTCTLAAGEKVHCELGQLAVGETARITVSVKAKNDDPEAGVEAENPDPFAGAGSAGARLGLARFARVSAATSMPWATVARARTKQSYVKHRSRGRAKQPDPNPNNNAAGRSNEVTPCQASVTIGFVKAASGCFRFHKKKRIYIAKGAVRINGIDLVGAAGGPIKIMIDPESGKLFSKGRIDVKLRDVVVYRGPFTFQMQRRSIKLLAKAAAKLKGLGINNVAVAWKPGSAAEIDVDVTLPKMLGSVRGKVTLRASLRNGVQLTNLRIEKEKVSVLKKLTLKDTLVTYDGGTNEWKGRTWAILPAPRAPKIKAAIEFTGKRLTRLALTGHFPSPGWLLGSTGIFLQKIGADVRTSPFALYGTMTATGGPRILKMQAAKIDGKLTLKPPVYRVDGNLEIVGGTLRGKGFVKYNTAGSVDLGGQMAFSRFGVGLNGSMKGWIAGLKAFSMEGKVNLSLPGPNVKGNGLVSDRGLAGCGRTKVFGKRLRLGFGYRWGRKSVDLMGSSCDVGKWKSRAASRTATASGASSRFTLPAGLPVAAFAVTGQGAAPSVSLVGPRGERVDTPADPGAHVETERFLLFRNPADATTYVAVSEPTAGAWTLVVDDGSAPVTSIRHADGLPASRVSARVTGRGKRRRLTWTANRIAGQRIQFVERGRGVTKLVTETAAARGSVRFKPVPAPRGKRRIVAVVLQDGLPRATQTVATYKQSARRKRR